MNKLQEQAPLSLLCYDPWFTHILLYIKDLQQESIKLLNQHITMPV